MALGAKSFSQRRRGPASELALFGKRLWSRWARLQPAAEVSINEAKGEAGGAGDKPRPSLPVSMLDLLTIHRNADSINWITDQMLLSVPVIVFSKEIALHKMQNITF